MTDLEIGFEQVKGAASRAGLNSDGWTLQRGSKVNGVHFELVIGTGRFPTASRRIKLGLTAKDAERFLDGMTQAFWLVQP